MGNKNNYIDRELSWLSFNARVLQEAEDKNVPMLERLRFLGIFSNNLDEYFRVRVAAVARMVKFGENKVDPIGGLTPEELYVKIKNTVVDQQVKFRAIYDDLVKEMRANDIYLINEKELTPAQGKYVHEFFHNKVFPGLVPIMIDKVKEFPYLRDRSIYLAVRMAKRSKESSPIYSMLRIPAKTMNRFFVLPEFNGRKYVIMLDDVIRYCLDDIFHIFDYDTIDAYTVKVTRDAELDIDDDIATSFIQKMDDSLKKRKKGSPVRLLYDREMPQIFLEYILKRMKITQKDNVVAGGRYHNHKDFMGFPEIGDSKHYYQPLPPLAHPEMEFRRSIIKTLNKTDLIFHYPYQNFSHFIDFIRESAIDPKVKEMGITIYRVAEESRVINALINAARNGKKVTVMIELQARFDEENNIFWSRKLQEEGVTVINGISGLKIHSKLAWVARKEKGEMRNYAYIGTGNFHEGTARVYADDGLLTSDKRIANEVANLFEFFNHNYLHYQYKHLIVSPFSMRNFWIEQIDKEIRNAKAGVLSYIHVKMNSLVDKKMIDKLYEASRAGVVIKLIVRGICCLIPGVKDMSENIEVISIVDKYLEHSRIFIFGNGGDEAIFISSADWMPRNLNRRIEVGVPIYNEEIKDNLRAQIDIQLMDNVKGRILDAECSNRYVTLDPQNKVRSQDMFYEYLKGENAEAEFEE